MPSERRIWEGSTDGRKHLEMHRAARIQRRHRTCARARVCVCGACMCATRAGVRAAECALRTHPSGSFNFISGNYFKEYPAAVKRSSDLRFISFRRLFAELETILKNGL